MTQAPQRSPRVVLGLRVKLLISFTLLFTVVFAAAYYWFYTYTTTRTLQRIYNDLSDTLVGTASQMDGDTIVALYRDPAATVRADGFTDDPRYWESLKWFEAVHELDHRVWPGTYVRDGDQLIFVTDLWANYDASKAAKFREVCDPDPEICGDPTVNFQALGGEVVITPEPYQDQWGYWVSGYAPLKNSKGEIVAGLFVDFEASYVLDVQQGIRDRTVGAFAITYAILFVLVYLLSIALTRPITELTKVAERIGEGQYEMDLKPLMQGRFPDENGLLAYVFGVMIDKVRGREQALLRRVEELEIRFDESKRVVQVREIVSTEFFQALRRKARTMRERLHELNEGGL